MKILVIHSDPGDILAVHHVDETITLSAVEGLSSMLSFYSLNATLVETERVPLQGTKLIETLRDQFGEVGLGHTIEEKRQLRKLFPGSRSEKHLTKPGTEEWLIEELTQLGDLVSKELTRMWGAIREAENLPMGGKSKLAKVVGWNRPLDNIIEAVAFFHDRIMLPAQHATWARKLRKAMGYTYP